MHCPCGAVTKAITLAEHIVVDECEGCGRRSHERYYEPEGFARKERWTVAPLTTSISVTGRKTRYAVMDFETSGLSPNSDRAIEIGAVIVEGGRIVDKYQSLINPGVNVPAKITELTGISTGMVRNAPPPKTVFGEFRKFVSGSMLVAHNASFEHNFWNAELNRLGYPNDEQFICTLLISRRLYPWSSNHKLGTLASTHNLPVDGSLHRALSDSKITAHLLIKIIEDLEELYPDGVVDSSFLARYQKALKADARSLPKGRAHSNTPRSNVAGLTAKSELDTNQTKHSSEPSWSTSPTKNRKRAIHSRGILKKEYSNGDVYEGQFKDGKRTGQGTYTWLSGSVYEGQWKDNEQHGLGTKSWANGDVYEGQFKDGKKTGQGTWASSHGDVYEGQWKDDIKHGQGTYTWPSGNVYEGQWKDNEPHGIGTKSWANGDVYEEGDWRNGKRNGLGTFTLSDGDVYEGQWKSDKKNGQGTYTWLHGDVYEGQWKDNEPHGVGTKSWANGDVYEGRWKDNEPHGFGVLNFNDQIFEGRWEDEDSGEGTISYSDGSIFKGEWDCDGRKHGECTFINGDFFQGTWWGDDMGDGYGIKNFSGTDFYHGEGDVYEGELYDGLPAGDGTLTRSNGDMYQGQFKTGVPNGKGLLTWSNGDVYLGQVDYSPHGEGIKTYSNGDVYEGEWRNGNKSGLGVMTLASGYIGKDYRKSELHDKEDLDTDWLESESYPKRWIDERGNSDEYLDTDWLESESYPERWIDEDGNSYKGGFKDGVPNNWGTKTYLNGDVYVGAWVKGEHSGRGTLTFENGEVYKGQFLDGLYDGTGTYSYPKGHFYEGQFKKGLYNGKGKLTSNDGIIFEGTFERESFSDGVFSLPQGATIKVNLKTIKPASKIRIIRGKKFEETEWRKLKKYLKEILSILPN